MRPSEPDTETQEPSDETSSPPQTFEEGFTLKTVWGVLFIALFMIPGGIYLGLVASCVIVAFGLTIVVKRASHAYAIVDPDVDV